MKILLQQKCFNDIYILNNCIRLGKALGLNLIFAGFTFAQNTSLTTKKIDQAFSRPSENELNIGLNSGSPFEAVKEKKEDVNKRDLYSKHYLNEDGSYTALIGAGPIHYQKEGQFFDIDHTITPNLESGCPYSYANKTNLFESYFGATAYLGVKNKTAEGEIREFLNTKMYWEVNGQATNTVSSADVSVSIQNDKAYYNQLYGNIHAEFITLTGKRKLNYIIPTLQDLGLVPENADYLVFTEDIILPNNWTYSVSEKGVLIQNEAGEIVCFYENPTSIDAADELNAEENTIFEIHLNGNVLTIKTKVKTTWLLSSDRQFPVKVDPSVNASPNGVAHRTAQMGSSGVGGYGSVAVGYQGGFYRSYASFDVSTVADGSTISSTVLYHNVGSTTGMGGGRGSELRAFLNDPESASYTTWASVYNTVTDATNSPVIYTTVTNLNTVGWKNSTLGSNANTHLGNVLSSIDKFTIGYRPSGTYTGGATNQIAVLYGEGSANIPYIAVTYTVPASMVCATLTNLTASLGTPVNGLAHHINLNWDALAGATGYDVQFSTDNITFTNATPSSVTTNSAELNAGDNPNARYWFRVRAKDGSQTCDWTNSTPIYTAADVPAIPLLTNAVGTTLDLTLQTETPVVNPAITTYSIVCSTTSQFVQANGSLGATEVFQTKAAWGTIQVTGLTSGTQYCFYAKAKNGDGHVVSGITLFVTQPFASNVLTTGASAGTNTWFAPNSYTPLSWSASNGCPSANGGIGFNGAWNNFWGNFLRLPAQNLTGINEITMTFDLSNSFTAGQIANNFRFYIHDGTAYRNPPTTAKIGSNTYTQQTVNNYFYIFDVARTCQQVTVTFDISGITNKSALLFYIEANSGYNNSNPFFVYLDNILLSKPAPTGCITTALAPTPVFHNFGGSQQIVFDNARYNSDRPFYRLSHSGTSPATSYQIEMNTKSDFTGTSITQTFTGSYLAQTQANFLFSNAESQLVDLTTYYVRARVDIGSGYGSWSTKTHSYTYDTGKTVANWFQTTTPQFSTDYLVGTETVSNYTTVVTPVVSGGGNVIQNGTFATTSNWTTYKTSGTGGAIEVNSTDCYNCPSGTTRNLKFYIFGGEALSGDIYVASQSVDLTGVDVLSLNLNGYYSGHGVGLGSVSNLRIIVGGTASNDAGNVLYTMNQPNCGTYCVASNNQILNLDVSSFSGTQTIKFVWKFTGTFYDTGLTAFYINNVGTSSTPPTPSGTIVSTPIRLASVQGATAYKELVWNQELNGGSITFDVQRLNTTTSLWENVTGFVGIQDASSNGEKSFDLESANLDPYDSIRIVGHLTGTAGGLKLNDWAIFFTIPETPLPVDLTAFSTRCENGESSIRWSTATEINSDKFIVEKSRDLIDWIFVAEQAAAGNSSKNINYFELDKNPWNGFTYYRLKQLDFDGQEKVYGPISVSCDKFESGITVYPNPNQGDFTLEISSAENMQNVQLQLTDLTGKIIASRTLNIQAGTTQIFFDGLNLQMGTYFIQFPEYGNQLKPVKVLVN